MLDANDEDREKDSCIPASPGEEDENEDEATSAMAFLLPQQVSRTPKTPVRTPMTPTTPVSRAEYRFLQRKERLAQSLEKVNRILERSKASRAQQATVQFDALEEEEEEEEVEEEETNYEGGEWDDIEDGSGDDGGSATNKMNDASDGEIDGLDVEASRRTLTMSSSGESPEDRGNGADDGAEESDDGYEKEDEFQVASSTTMSHLMLELRVDEEVDESGTDHDTASGARRRLRTELRVDTGEVFSSSHQSHSPTQDDWMQRSELEEDLNVDENDEDAGAVSCPEVELGIDTNKAFSSAPKFQPRPQKDMDVSTISREKDIHDVSLPANKSVPNIDEDLFQSRPSTAAATDQFMDIFRTWDGNNSREAADGTPSLIEFGFGAHAVARVDSNDSSLTGDKDDTAFLLRPSFNVANVTATSKENNYGSIGNGRLAHIRRGRIKDYKINIKGPSSSEKLQQRQPMNGNVGNNESHHVIQQQQQDQCPQFLPSLNYSTMRESDEFVGLVMPDDKVPSPMWGEARRGGGSSIAAASTTAMSIRSAADIVKRMRKPRRKHTSVGDGGDGGGGNFEQLGQSFDEVAEGGGDRKRQERVELQGPTYDYCAHSSSMSDDDDERTTTTRNI